MNRTTKRIAVLAVAAVSVAAGAYSVFAAPAPAPAPAAAPPGVATAPAAASAASTLPDFTAIVRRYGPAVVNVSTATLARTGLGDAAPGAADPDEPLWRFFRRFGLPQPQGEVVARGLGSGFIVASDGVILTNAHVVDGASDITVKLVDGRELPARVVGVDPPTDVAVLRVAADHLPTVKIGDPAGLQVGSWVLAIGAPFGFENSATAGIVSARGRSLPDEGYVPFLQTDVAVNPGNSGGPLFDLSGQVVGINSQIYSRSGGYMGLSFAIPIDVAMKVEGQLLAHGKVVRGRLGVTVQRVDQSLAESFRLPRPEGALVSSVEPGSPAAEAGVKPGDVILSLDQRAIGVSSELPPRVGELAPGSRAVLDVWREGGHRQVSVVVGEASQAAAPSAPGAADGRGRLGLAVRPLTPEERREDGVRGGLLVEGVTGPAARAGIEPGDVVLAASGAPVEGVEQLRGIVARAGKHLALLVQRRGARVFVPVTLG